ncbi:MAG: PIG-L family deacetylase [Armatimonadota bacterium]|nr:PIG-L family deacetylase [Armatimonadota bacterium]MDR7486449.1 PIG-L family deacetylase [Armatimonadota bacterium]MDR7532215.1 PIG-L family deacetylase [Armatimonadota bacterium]MDR7537210.1 PIG-L family deacetylase [Armatimonadota bacterium]
MGVSCIIAAYNEECRIAGVLAAARRVREVTEIIVVSDGSTDRTAEAAAASGADLVVTLPRNLGKGGAIMAGARRASEPVLLLLDADLANLNPAEISALIAPVLHQGRDMALGVLARDLLQAVLPQLSGIRVVRRDALLAHPHLALTRFGFERALTELGRRARWTVARVPLTGVVHPTKEQKYGLVQGYQGKVRMTLEILAPHRRRRRGAGPVRRGVLVATGLVVVLGYLSMGLFATSRAIGSQLEPFPEPAPGDRVLIVAAHADDEMLAAGGLMQRVLAVGGEVYVVFATNGDGNRLAAAIGGRRLIPRPADFIAEGMERQREAQRALGRLGIPQGHLFFLGYPDRGLMALARQRRARSRPFVSPFTRTARSPYPLAFRPNALYTGDDLQHDLETILLMVRPTVILTHHPADRHPDHQALFQFILMGLRALEHHALEPWPRVYTYLVHAWDYPRPLRYAPEADLLPPKSLRDGYRWLRFDLRADELAAKQAAIRDYKTQMESPYLRLLLSSFIRQNELFAVAEP